MMKNFAVALLPLLFLQPLAVAESVAPEELIKITYKSFYDNCVTTANNTLADKKTVFKDKDTQAGYVTSVCQCGTDKVKATFPTDSLLYIINYSATEMVTPHTDPADPDTKKYHELMDQYLSLSKQSGIDCAEIYFAAHPEIKR